jgi:uncharacterized protein YidB (DUF937 family)
MDFKNLATQIVMSKIAGANNSSTAESALDDLVDGNKKFDLIDIVGQFTGSGGDLASKAKSWLGDGANESISASQLQEVLGKDKIESFATKLGIGTDEASSKLSEIMPELIDKSSQGGNLLASVGGAKGLRGLASKFFN